MQLTNCAVSLILTWSKICVLTSKATRDVVPGHEGNPAIPAINNRRNPTFNITDTMLYVLGVTLSTEENNELLQQLKQDLKDQLNEMNINHKWLIRLKITI